MHIHYLGTEHEGLSSSGFFRESRGGRLFVALTTLLAYEGMLHSIVAALQREGVTHLPATDCSEEEFTQLSAVLSERQAEKLRTFMQENDMFAER